MRLRRPSARMLVLALAAVTAALLVLGGGTSRSAFTGAITNNTDTVQTWRNNCRQGELADNPTRMYSLASSGGSTNLGSAGSGTDATLIGNALGIGWATGGGCKRDPQSYYSVTPALAGILARWITTGKTTPISAGSVLSQEVWFYASSAKGLIMGFGNDGSAANGSTVKGLQVFLMAGGRLDFATYDGSNHELLSPANTNYADGNWHQVVAVYNAGDKSLYVDGALVSTGSGPSETIAGGGYWRLGNDSLSGWTNAPTGLNATYLNGGLQWAALYPTALTAAQVTAHYRAGVG